MHKHIRSVDFIQIDKDLGVLKFLLTLNRNEAFSLPRKILTNCTFWLMKDASL